MKKSFSVISLAGWILLSQFAAAQGQSSDRWNHQDARTPPAWTSVTSFGGSGADTGEAIEMDRDGNTYVTGGFSSTAYFPLHAAGLDHGRAPQPAPTRKAMVSAGGTDIFLAKYDAAGKQKWLIRAGGAGDDHGIDLAFDAAGNVYVTGVFVDNAKFRGTSSPEIWASGQGRTIFLAKYRPSGALVWVQTGTTYSGATNEGYGVAVEPLTGSVYVTGISQSTTTFSSSNGATHSVYGPGTWHMVLVKYDTAGTFQWGQSNQAEPNSLGRRLAVDLDNNVYVTGWMEGWTTFHSNDGHDLSVQGLSWPVQSGPDYPGDAFVVKYDENGNVQWVNQIGGYKANANDVATSRDGRVSITGIIGNIPNSPAQAATIVTSQPGGNSINLGGGQFTFPYNRDVFTATYDSDGVLLDARRFGGAQDDVGTAIAYDRRGRLVVAGVFQDKIRIEGRALAGKGAHNLFVARFARDDRMCVAEDGEDSDGRHVFLARTLASLNTADGNFLIGGAGVNVGFTAGGNVLVTGEYVSVAQFDGFKLQSLGQQDGFAALLDIGERRRGNAGHRDRD